MNDLHVSLGSAARVTLCAALDAARRSIDAQFYSVGDPAVIDVLNQAARRGVDVTIHVEGDRGRYQHHGAHVPIASHVAKTAAHYAALFDPHVHVLVESDPHVLEHAKAAVVDNARAFVATANPNAEGFADPGEVMIEDDAPVDVAAVRAAIAGGGEGSARVVDGPNPLARARIENLFNAASGMRVAMEDLSDRDVVRLLIERRARGLHDEVLVKVESDSAPATLRDLRACGVDVRALPHQRLHEKYVDAGDRIYVGSGNLTRNGLDEAREIGIIAPAADFDDGAAALRADFDRLWSSARPIAA